MESNDKKVLIIDDLEINIRLAEISLKRANYSVISASNGEDGCRMAIENQPSLILLDIGLPGISGFEFLDFIKKNKLTREIPVIMYSTYDQVEYINKAFKKGAADYLVKPVSSNELICKIERFINSSMN